MKVLVLGVGGQTGDAAVSVLVERGLTVRALVRRPSRVAEARDRGAWDVVVGDLDDVKSIWSAINGVDAMYFVAPVYSEREAVWVANALASAKAAGVDRFVYHSVLHPWTPSMPHHRRKAAAEIAVRSSGLGWTILQPAMYAQTVLRVRERSARGLLSVPYAPDSVFSVVDVEDVAACLAAVLLNDDHVYGSYEIAGPSPSSFRELAGQLNEVFGERRHVVQVAPEDAPMPVSWSQQQRIEYVAMCREYDAHGLIGSGATTAALLGRPPSLFRDVLVREAVGR